MTELVATQGVVVRYGATTALASADVSVAAGEAVALVGPSGAGKSTLLLCLAGLVRPQAGRVLFDGDDLMAWRPDELAAHRLRRCGFVFQGGDLMPELTLEENVELPLRLAGMTRRDSRPRAHEMLDRLGVLEARARRPDEVSGGQAQRAAVARAVVHRPAVVFADEPTGALDSENARAVMGLLLEQVAAVGAALVMVTHDRSLAALTGRTLEVRDGVVHPVEGPARAEQLPRESVVP